MAAVSEVPRDLATAESKCIDWVRDAAAKLPGLLGIAFWGLVALVIVLYWPALWISRRGGFRPQTSRARNRLQKILAVWRVTLVVAGLPIAATAAVGAIAAGFGLIDPSASLPRTLFLAVARVAVVAGIGLGLLAPGQRERRLLKIDDATRDQILRAAVVLAVLVSGSRVVESFAATIDASLNVQGLLRGLGAGLAALVLATALWIRKAPEERAAATSAPALSSSYDVYGLLRLALWLAIVAILTAVLSGYMNLARFLVNQVIWVGVIGAVTAMLFSLVEQTTRVGFAPRTPFGRSLMMSTGLRRDSFEQLAVLLSGVTRVVIFVIALLMTLAPWGVQSSDVSGYLYSAFFGFKVGNITISLSRIAFALFIFAAGYLVTRTVERWLTVSFLPRTRLDIGLRNAIDTSFGYIGWILSIGFALAYLGLDFEKLALVASALSVGIGFGLQSVVNNFVSGLILLWERRSA
jgi:small-conductance mechanosensitive channel